MKKLLKILLILLIISSLAYFAGTMNVFHDLISTKKVNGEIPTSETEMGETAASETEVGETVVSETDLPWYERDTVVFELGKFYHVSGKIHGNYVYTGVDSGGATITLLQSNIGALVLHVALNQIVYIDIYQYEVIRITPGSITLRKIE